MTRQITRRLSLSLVVIGTITMPVAYGQNDAPSPTRLAPTPQWQTAAGGTMSFEVASVKQDLSGKYVSPPFSIDSDDSYTPTGGLFTAQMPLTSYISFAFKLDQQNPMISNLPNWVSTERFEIQARAAGNPTKDQLRLMMQSLLADRFKLAIHFETRELPVLTLTLIKPGKLGPGLRLHADGPPCEVTAPYSAAAVNINMFPCNVIMATNRPDHTILAGARNTTVQLMAAFFTNVGHTGRPVVDRTGLNGKIDFAMEYMPESRNPPSTSGDSQPDLPGETFLGAIKDQLGLKLDPVKAPLNIPVVDHIERPSEN